MLASFAPRQATPFNAFQQIPSVMETCVLRHWESPIKHQINVTFSNEIQIQMMLVNFICNHSQQSNFDVGQQHPGNIWHFVCETMWRIHKREGLSLPSSRTSMHTQLLSSCSKSSICTS